MFAAVGNHVVALHRERIGDITLDDALAPGEYRPLQQKKKSIAFIYLNNNYILSFLSV